MRGAPAVLWNGAKDPLGKGFGTELMPSGKCTGAGGHAGSSWQAQEPQAVHSAHCHCSCHWLQSASIQLGMARAGMSLHPPLNEKSKVKQLMNNRKKHSDHHLFQGGGTSAEQSALVKT